MSGVKGMRHWRTQRKARSEKTTQVMWEILRANHVVSINTMLRYLEATPTVGEVSESFVRKYIRSLERHGYLKRQPLRPGCANADQGYIPVADRCRCSYQPTVCSDCGQPLQTPVCQCRPHLAPERDRLWQAMRAVATFTTEELVNVTGASTANARKWVGELINHGYIERVTEPRPGAYAQYRLAAPADEHHPLKCERCGQPIRCKTCVAHKEKESQRDKAASDRELLWLAMQTLPDFTVLTLRQRTDASERTTRLLVKALVRHGYAEAAGAISPEGAAIYRLTQLTEKHLPSTCARCGQPLSAASCTHKERKTETRIYSTEVRHAAL